MQYMALIYHAPGSFTGDWSALKAAYGKLTEEMIAAGVFKAADELSAPETATSVRVRGGARQVTDGPFAETKEHLGGYYLLDCPDLDTALGWAARIPTAEYGTIEVRPVAAG
ncbi:MAG: YciI family protein [Pseudomonadota bacterium]